MLCKGHPSGLGQKGGQRDTLGLQLLVQGVKLVSGDGVADAELWDLAMQQLSSQDTSSLLAHLDANVYGCKGCHCLPAKSTQVLCTSSQGCEACHRGCTKLLRGPV